jgi:hypothetical protein
MRDTFEIVPHVHIETAIIRQEQYWKDVATLLDLYFPRVLISLVQEYAKIVARRCPRDLPIRINPLANGTNHQTFSFSPVHVVDRF